MIKPSDIKIVCSVCRNMLNLKSIDDAILILETAKHFSVIFGNLGEIITCNDCYKGYISLDEQLKAEVWEKLEKYLTERKNKVRNDQFNG